MKNIVALLAVLVCIATPAAARITGPNEQSKASSHVNKVIAPVVPKMLSGSAGKKGQFSFVENVGEVTDQNNTPRSDIQYKLAAGPGLNIFIGNGAIHYQFSKSENKHPQATNISATPETATDVSMYRMDVELVGANNNAKVVTAQPLSYYENYLTKNSGGHSNIAHAYNQITYKDVYPGIDWVLYIANGRLKHEFIVRKGGDIASIKLRYKGANNISINSKGILEATTPQGTITEQAPYSYQANKQAVSSRFVLHGDVLGYEVAEHNGDLVIDPTLEWSTYFGSTGDETITSLSKDNIGNMYATGSTNSIAFIATTGAFQTTYAGNNDAFLVKFNSSGTLLWATYYGGTGNDGGTSVATDHGGNVYLTGYTTSATGLGTSGMLYTSYQGGTNDAFLAKFNSYGSLQWGTYYGGTLADNAQAVTTDKDDNIIMVGYTSSTGGIASTGGYEVAFNGGATDAFMVKFSPAGTRIWGTYFGGTGVDYAYGVTTDTAGTLYVVGATSSSSSIVGIYGGFAGGTTDGYLVKMNSAGIWLSGKYFGGPLADQLRSVARDQAGNTYVAGYTNSTTGVATGAAIFQPAYGGGANDGFYAKILPNGAEEWCSYYGGADDDALFSVSTDVVGNIFMAGQTKSTAGISSAGAYQPAIGGDYDGFVAKISVYGIRRWATYIGGNGIDNINCVENDDSGNVYVGGRTSSLSGISSAVSSQPVYGGGTSDGYLLKFRDECVMPYPGRISGPSSMVCPGAVMTLSDTVTGGVWTSTRPYVATVSGGVVTGLTMGVSFISYTVTNSCGTRSAVYRLTVGEPIIKTVAGGDATVGYTGDGGSALGALMWDPQQTIADKHGNIFITDVGNHVVRKVNAAGIISTVVGNGTTTYLGDGFQATATGLDVACIALDNADNLYITSEGGNRVLKMNPAGVLTCIAGTGTAGYSGDGGPATAATLSAPCGIIVDDTGNVYLTEISNHVVRKINTSGIIKTIAGNGTPGQLGDDFPATLAQLYTPVSVALDGLGNVYVSCLSEGHIRKIDTEGIITRYWGVDGLSSIQWGITMDKHSHMYVADRYTYKVTMINSDGVMSTIAGTGGNGYTGDGGAARLAKVFDVTTVALDTADNIYINDEISNVRKITPGLQSVGPVTGTDSICTGITTTLTNDITGGTWSSSDPSIATVGATGAVTGVAAGTATITYSVTYCSTVYATKTITVSTITLNTGATTSLCSGSTISLANATAGGVWTCANPFVATVGATGVVTGVAGGTAAISYTTPNHCRATTLVTVTSSSGPILPASPVVCVGTSVNLTNNVSGGTWSSSAPSVITVSASGVMTGVSPGTATISYTTTGMCALTRTVLATVSATPVPNAGVITGTATVCPAATTTLSNPTGDAGGVWSSVTPSRATINSSGVVTGVVAGTVLISYTVTNTCGTAAATRLVTISPLPAAGTITGTTTICPAAVTTLSDIASGGVWSSADPTIATVTATGLVTGVAVGTVTISYAVTNSCGVAVATKPVTVNAGPNTGAITGILNVCRFSTTALSNATAATGGVWSSATTSTATITSSGLVTAVAAGTSVISYTVTNACGIAAATAVVTVDAPPAAGISTGAFTTCMGSSVTLSNPVPGGVWSTSAPATATISASGMVTGLVTGTSNISYTVTNSCGSNSNITAFTVITNPVAGAIIGAATVCPAASVTLSNPSGSAGGVWSVANPAVATISSSGVATGVAGGTSLISYTATNACGTATATTTLNVSPAPNAGAIAGTATVCPAATTTLSDIAPGGVWSSAAAGTATVTAAGVVTGVSAGTATISYTVTNSCGAAAATQVVTVSSFPNAGSIVGSATVCPSATISLSNPAGDVGGTWSSATPAVATVSASGVVTGVAAGTSLISYTVTNICGTSATSLSVTVNPLADAGIITGTGTVCVAATTALGNAAGGGVWSSSALAQATVGSTGIVTGVSAGSATISYTVTNSCNVAVATLPVTVTPLADAGVITGASFVCQGLAITLSDAITGGVWSSAVAGTATVTTAGVVTGVAAGTVTISYTVTNSCGAVAAIKVVTVNPLPAAITGTATVCVGNTTTLSDPTSLGTWSASNTNITIGGSSGLVTGVTAGTSVVTYTLPTTCIATAAVTVNALPLAYTVTGGGNYCAGGTGVHVGLTGSATGVQYQLFNGTSPAGSALAGTGAALDFGLVTVAGTYTVVATNITTTCDRNMGGSAVVVINPLVVPSVAVIPSFVGASACSGNTITFTGAPVNGGSGPAYQWHVNSTVVGSAAGSYSYTPVDGDIISVTMIPGSGVCTGTATATGVYTVSVLASLLPAVSVSVSPGSTLCLGDAATFTAIPVTGGVAPAYIWNVNGTNVATGLSYTTLPANGDVVSVKMASNYFCRLADTVTSAATTMTVQTGMSAPVLSITANPGTSITSGETVTLTVNATGGTAVETYQWLLNGTAIGGATNASYSSSTFSNGDIVACKVVNTDACPNGAIDSVTINTHGVGVAGTATQSMGITMYPDPNNGAFIISGQLSENANDDVVVTIVNPLGQTVYRSILPTRNGTINHSVQLGNNLASGMYMLNLKARNDSKTLRFVISK